MDNEVLVSKLRTYINKQEQNDRHFNLAMLIDDEPTTVDSHYSLFLSSKWLDDKSPRQAVNEVMRDIIEEVGVTSDEYRKISRVSIIKTSDPFVAMLTSAYSVCNDTVNITNYNINGLFIEKGTLLESHNPKFDIRQSDTKHRSIKKSKK